MPATSVCGRLALLVTIACARREAPTPAAKVSPVARGRTVDTIPRRVNDSVSVRTTALDSVRGRLTLTGPLATAIAWLSMPDGQSLRVIGLPNNILRQLAGGLELVLFGARTSGGMRGEPMIVVDDYAVRAVGGEPAYDGILRREPTGDVLELRDGRRLAIRRLPEVLADANGKHVWVGGPLQAPTMAGIIDPDRQFRMQRLPR